MTKNNYKIHLLAVFAIIFAITASLSVSTVHAQEADTSTITPLIDGMPTVYLIAGVAVVGILLQTYKGMIGKSRKDFDVNQLIFTVIVGIGASIILVGNAFQNITTDMNPSELMIFLVQQVLTVMGAKGVADYGKKFVQKANTPKEFDPKDIEPIDDPDDLPPGKDTVEFT